MEKKAILTVHFSELAFVSKKTIQSRPAGGEGGGEGETTGGR
jgi:hypothetical protein